MTAPISHHAPVRWPDAASALGEVYARDWRRRLKYVLRRWLTTRGRRRVLDHVATSSAAQALLAHAPRAFYPVMHKHLDRRFGLAERASAMIESLRGMERALGTDRSRRLFEGAALTLARLPDGTRVTLNLNRLTFHEGLWALDLTGIDGARLYTISFGWSDGATLMMACVQGPPREIDGRQCMRDLTDAAHGLRPGFLLMAMLRLCARAWGVGHLVGVDDACQVKGRWNHKATARHFDYLAFWTDIGGVRRPDGNWEIPLLAPQRAIEDVPAKRRAMYRRRHALLEAMTLSAGAALDGRELVAAAGGISRGHRELAHETA